MGFGLDPELRRQLEILRGMVSRQHEVPTREWPLIFVEENDALLVVREWPSGALTSYHLPRAGQPPEL